MIRARDIGNKCIKCNHRTNYSTCKAFPNRIPLAFQLSIAEHGELVDGQEGDYLFELHNRFKDEDDKFNEINEDKLISNLYPRIRKKLPRLIIKEIIRQGYELKKIEVITFKGKRDFDGPYIAEINLFRGTETETISLKMGEDNSLEREIFDAFSKIYFIENLLDFLKETVHLKIYGIENYEYVDNTAVSASSTSVAKEEE